MAANRFAPPLVWQFPACTPFMADRLTPSVRVFLEHFSAYAESQGDSVVFLPFTRIPWTHRGVTFCLHAIAPQPQSYSFKESFLHGWVQVDPMGYSGWHSENYCQYPVPDLLPDEKADVVRRLARYVEAGGSKYKQPPAQDGLPVRYVFLPLQKPQDSSSHFGRFDVGEIVPPLVAWCGKKGIQLVIKRHPFCHSARMAALVEAWGAHDNVKIVDGDSVACINGALFIVSMNSGVGFEALMRGKPVVSFGLSEYTQATLPVRALASFETTLDEALMKADDEAYAQALVQKAQSFVAQTLVESQNERDIARLYRRLKSIYARDYALYHEPIFPLEDCVDFSEQGNGGQYLLHGFSFVEEWGVWSDGRVATLLFLKPEGLSEETSVYELLLRAYVKPQWTMMGFDVVVNQRTVLQDQWILEGQGDQSVSFPIRWQLGLNTLSLRVKGSLIPAEVQADFDTREIGLGLIKLVRRQ